MNHHQLAVSPFLHVPVNRLNIGGPKNHRNYITYVDIWCVGGRELSINTKTLLRPSTSHQPGIQAKGTNIYKRRCHPSLLEACIHVGEARYPVRARPRMARPRKIDMSGFYHVRTSFALYIRCSTANARYVRCR